MEFRSGRELWSILVVASMRLMQSVPAVKYASEFPLLTAINKYNGYVRHMPTSNHLSQSGTLPTFKFF